MNPQTSSERNNEEAPLAVYACEELGCARQFDSERGLGIHSGRAHGTGRALRQLLGVKKTAEAAILDSMDQYSHTTSHLAADEEILAPDMDVAVEKLWAECDTREQLIEDFLANYNETSQAVSRPADLLLRASAVSHEQFAPVYAMLMATVSSVGAHRNEYLDALPRELHHHQATANIWDNCVLLFTWCGAIIWQWPGAYPRVKDLLTRYLRLSEEDLVRAGGWNAVSRQQRGYDIH
jgi:hypothetical protein